MACVNVLVACFVWMFRLLCLGLMCHVALALMQALLKLLPRPSVV
jgi:hypothetical protein